MAMLNPSQISNNRTLLIDPGSPGKGVGRLKRSKPVNSSQKPDRYRQMGKSDPSLAPEVSGDDPVVNIIN